VIDEALLEPVFQPIVDLTSGRAVGYEALTRFAAEPAQSPDRWFADADLVGLRTELELAAAQMAITRFAAVDQSRYISLNASPATLPSCCNLVEALEPGRIVIEITEHAAIDDYEALAPAVNQLRERGTLLAVDDAGAGFASFRHTLLLSPDFIKLDISLTRDIDSDRRRRALAAALIGFANELDATIIAEGIQTAAELKALRELGVTHGQGHLLANPGPLPRGHARPR
jgi:EAL domain-containing protein (putative c-di-GMP-specific phosphodiesterase class I)